MDPSSSSSSDPRPLESPTTAKRLHSSYPSSSGGDAFKTPPPTPSATVGPAAAAASPSVLDLPPNNPTSSKPFDRAPTTPTPTPSRQLPASNPSSASGSSPRPKSVLARQFSSPTRHQSDPSRKSILTPTSIDSTDSRSLNVNRMGESAISLSMDIDPDLQSALDTDDQPTPPPLRYIEEDSSPGSSHFGHGRTVTDGSEADDRMLSLEEIVAHRTALATGLENPEELRRIGTRLADHAIVFDELRRKEKAAAQDKVSALTADLSAMSLQLSALPSVYSSMASTDRAMWEVENELLRRQAKVLAKKAVFGPSGQPSSNSLEFAPEGMQGSGLNVATGPASVYAYPYGANGLYSGNGRGFLGFETDVEAENKLLQSDRKHLKRRLKEAEGQVHRLESELRRLRSHLLTGAPIMYPEITHIYEPPHTSSPRVSKAANTTAEADVAEGAATVPEGENVSPSRRESRRKRYPTMGDAEAEHLLLAGRRLTHIKRHQRVAVAHPLGAASDEEIDYADLEYANLGVEGSPGKARRRGGGAPGSPQKMSGSPGKAPATPGRRRMSTSGARAPTTPQANGRGRRATLTSGGSPSSGDIFSPPKTGGLTPAFGGMNELLHAAQTVLTRPTTPEGSASRRVGQSAVRNGMDGELEVSLNEGSPKRRKVASMPGVEVSFERGGAPRGHERGASEQTHLGSRPGRWLPPVAGSKGRISKAAKVVPREDDDYDDEEEEGEGLYENRADVVDDVDGHREYRSRETEGPIDDTDVDEADQMEERNVERALVSQGSRSGAGPSSPAAAPAHADATAAAKRTRLPSALDVLADQAASQQSSQGSAPRGVGYGGGETPTRRASPEDQGPLGNPFTLRQDGSRTGPVTSGARGHSPPPPRPGFTAPNDPRVSPSKRARSPLFGTASSATSGSTSAGAPIVARQIPGIGNLSPSASVPPTFSNRGPSLFSNAGPSSSSSLGRILTLEPLRRKRPPSIAPSPKLSSSNGVGTSGPSSSRPAVSFRYQDSPDGPIGLTPAAALAQKQRSPYVKWTENEDELLIKAVIEHGQRWDAVSKGVPTRSYHQCRQRWLRGLKRGDRLPEKLQHYYPEVQETLRRFEAQRKIAGKGQTRSESDEDQEEGDDAVMSDQQPPNDRQA